MKYIKIIIYLNFILFFSSCASVKEGFSNQKRNNSDEFLVEKKSPLITPPDYNNLPVPSPNDKPLNDNSAIKSLISNENDKDNKNNNLKELNKNFEESLIEKIKN